MSFICMYFRWQRLIWGNKEFWLKSLFFLFSVCLYDDRFTLIAVLEEMAVMDLLLRGLLKSSSYYRFFFSPFWFLSHNTAKSHAISKHFLHQHVSLHGEYGIGTIILLFLFFGIEVSCLRRHTQ